MSGGRSPNPSPSFPPSFLSFSQLSFWEEVDFYQSSSLQQAVRKHKHVNHRQANNGEEEDIDIDMTEIFLDASFDSSTTDCSTSKE